MVNFDVKQFYVKLQNCLQIKCYTMGTICAQAYANIFKEHFDENTFSHF